MAEDKGTLQMKTRIVQLPNGRWGVQVQESRWKRWMAVTGHQTLDESFTLFADYQCDTYQKAVQYRNEYESQKMINVKVVEETL
jgi:hypothetical protein